MSPGGARSPEIGIAATRAHPEAEPAIAHHQPGLLILGALLGCSAQDPPGSSSANRHALRFDGRDDQVRLASMPEPGARGWTVEAWIKPQATDQQRPDIVARRSPRGGQDSYTFRIRRDYGRVLELGIASAEGTWGMSGTTPLPDGRWSHVAASWDPASAEISLVVDGELDAVREAPFPPGTGPAPLWLGGDPLHGAQQRPFAGSLDELRIWSVARSPQQIEAHRGRVLSGSEPQLQLYWPCDDGQGQRVTDLGPGQLHGTLGSSPEPDDHDPSWASELPF